MKNSVFIVWNQQGVITRTVMLWLILSILLLLLQLQLQRYEMYRGIVVEWESIYLECKWSKFQSSASPARTEKIPV